MASKISEGAHPLPIVFGYEEEWRAFGTRHGEFLSRFPNIEKAIDLAFQRTLYTDDLVDRTLYFLGRIATEEFMEILLLCANGYGIGAKKLVRGMYERAVTARYLDKNPNEVDNYLAFHKITHHKLLKAVRSTMGTEVFSDAETQKIERDFEEVKERFMVTDCKTCKTRRLNFTWSKVDFVSMAKIAGPLGQLIVPGYYLPTTEAHSAIGAIFSRLDTEAADKGDLIFDGAAQRGHADNAFITAHNILLDLIDLQKERFHLEALDTVLQTCLADFMVIWKDYTPHAVTTSTG
jgi:hypothetical protein